MPAAKRTALATGASEQAGGYMLAHLLERLRPQRSVETPLPTIEANIDGMIFCER